MYLPSAIVKLLAFVLASWSSSESWLLWPAPPPPPFIRMMSALSFSRSSNSSDLGRPCCLLRAYVKSSLSSCVAGAFNCCRDEFRESKAPSPSCSRPLAGLSSSFAFESLVE